MDANQKLLDFIMDCGVFYYAVPGKVLRNPKRIQHNDRHR